MRGSSQTRRAALALGALIAAASIAAWIQRPSLPQHQSSEREHSTIPAPRAGRASAIDSLARLGYFRDAVLLARADVEEETKRGGPISELVDRLTRLGTLQIEQGETYEAVAILREAWARCEHDSGIPVSSRSAALLALARAEKDRGMYDASEGHYDAALELARSAGPDRRRIEVSALCGKAHLIRRTHAGRILAVELFQKALALAHRTPRADSEDIASVQSGLALVLLQLGRAAEAERLLRESMPTVLRDRGRDHLDVGLAQSLWGYSQYLLGRYGEAEKSYRQAMATYARARLHLEPGINRRRAVQRIALNLAGSLLAQGRGEEAWEALEEGLSSYLAERLSESEEMVPAEPIAPGTERPRVQALLDSRTAVIGWIDVNLVSERPAAAWAFAIRNDGPVHWVQLHSSSLLDQPFHIEQSNLQKILLRDSQWPARVTEYSEAEQAGRGAWRERIEPLEPFLHGVDRLICVNAWSARTVPIEAFVDPDGRLLLDRFDVCYAPSSRVYSKLRDRSGAPSRGAPRALLVESGGGGGRHLAGLYPPLPAASREIDGIVETLPAATVLQGGAARAQSLRELVSSGELGHYDVLHFAAHTTFDVRIPGSAAIVLGASSGDTDDILTAAEIEHWRLKHALVTLSGCQTSGLQLIGTSPGLAESFLVAGAHGVVVSLWSVDDRATALLMRRFYALLARDRQAASVSTAAPGCDAVHALRDAKLWLRDLTDESGTKPFQNPAYWAGFVFIGAN
jgi:CHAT domain-containing protein